MRKKTRLVPGIFGVILALLLISMTSGCAMTSKSDNQQMATTTTHTFNDTGQEVSRVTETKPIQQRERGFFASENLEMFYDSEGKRIDAHERMATKKLEAVQANALRRPATMSNEASAYANAMDALIIAGIKESAPPSTARPKTMADVADNNIGNLGMIGLGIYDRVSSHRQNNYSSTTGASYVVENSQFYGNALIGVEGDTSWADLKTGTSANGGFNFNGQPTTSTDTKVTNTSITENN